jgi:hypothetical protein
MKKEYFTYIFLGIVAGLVTGFIVANWTTTSAVTGGRGSGTPQTASVNTSSQEQELPPGHPPVPGAQTAPSQQLPPNHPPIDGSQTAGAPPLPMGSQPTSQPGGFVEMPSLDPLPAGSRETRAEQEYRNIQLLRGLPADRIPVIMESFRSALGVDCTYCHIQNQFERDDRPMKKVAREMIQLTRDTNTRMGGAARVTCNTCHRGQPRPPQ